MGGTATEPRREITICSGTHVPPVPQYRIQTYVTRRPSRPPRNPIMPPRPCDETRPDDRQDGGTY